MKCPRRSRAAGLAHVPLWVLLLLGSAPAWAGDPSDASPGLSGEVELGGRVLTGDFGSAKWEEYRELRPGLFGRGHLLLEDAPQQRYLRAWLSDVGERDERYALELGRYGHYRLELDYSELPHAFSNQSRSPYRLSGRSDLVLPSGFRERIQAQAAFGNAARSQALGDALAGVPGGDVDFRLRDGRGALLLFPLPELEFSADYRIQDRQGRRPWALGFGTPGGHFVNVSAPIDERIHEVNSALRLLREAWNLELAYTGSFFQNDLDSLTVDNPLVALDAPGAASRGRISLEPDNASHVFRLAGSGQLPVSMPTRLALSFAYGLRRQDEDFLCHTVNSAFLVGSRSRSCPLARGTSSLSLPDNSLDGDVRTFLANVVLTARPTPKLNLTARYRLYDYDNETPELTFPAHVENDEILVEEQRIAIAPSWRRQQASLDLAARLPRRVTLRIGSFWEQWSRSNEREVRRLDEYGGKLGIDWKPSARAQLRADFEWGIRRGNEYRTFAFLEQTLPASEVEEASRTSQLRDLRKFDEADRSRQRFDLLARLVPHEDVTLSFSGRYGRKDYDTTDYGLLESHEWSLGSDLAWRPTPRMGLTAWYSFEELRYEQRSRWRPRSFFPVVVIDDRSNDWRTDSQDQIHSVGLDLELWLVPDRLELGIGYTLQHARGKERTRGPRAFVAAPPPTTSGDGGNPFSAPGLEDVLQSFDLSLRFHWSEAITLVGLYRYERYDVTNFRRDDLDPFEAGSGIDGSGAIAPSLDVFLADRVGDYAAHLLALSVVYRF